MDAIVQILRRQFQPTVEMLSAQLEACPDSLWNDREFAFWKQMFHSITGIKFWFRQGEEAFALPDFGREIVDDFDRDNGNYITKQEMAAYFEELINKAERFFDSYHDEKLSEPADVYDQMAVADVILGQIRHIQHHVGICNQILRQNGVDPVKWTGYGE